MDSPVSIKTDDTSDFYDEAYFLGTSERRGNFSLLELDTKFYDRTQTVIDFFDLEHVKEGTIAEIGCGTAPFYRIMSKNTALNQLKVVCTDITESGIKLLNDDQRPPFRRADAENLPFGSATLLGVVEWDILEHISHPKKALAEVYRVLRPDGFLHIVCPNPDSWLRYDVDPDKDPYRRDKSHIFPPIVTVDFLDKMLRELGFKYTVYTRGFKGQNGKDQVGIKSMRLARQDKSGSHIVAFARKP